jgi:ribonuclease-3
MSDEARLSQAREMLRARIEGLVGPGPIPRLDESLTHPSYGNEVGMRDNQRLEFLGDAVLGLCVSEMLVVAHADADEGVLTRMRSALVNGEALAAWARSVDLGSCVAFGRGAMLGSERERTKVLADATEALVAAVYEAHGLAGARALVGDIVHELLADAEALSVRDPKSALQERVQAGGGAGADLPRRGDSRLAARPDVRRRRPRRRARHRPRPGHEQASRRARSGHRSARGHGRGEGATRPAVQAARTLVVGMPAIPQPRHVPELSAHRIQVGLVRGHMKEALVRVSAPSEADGHAQEPLRRARQAPSGIAKAIEPRLRQPDASLAPVGEGSPSRHQSDLLEGAKHTADYRLVHPQLARQLTLEREAPIAVDLGNAAEDCVKHVVPSRGQPEGPERLAHDAQDPLECPLRPEEVRVHGGSPQHPPCRARLRAALRP